MFIKTYLVIFLKLISVLALTESSPNIGMGHLVRSAQLLTCLDSNKFKFKIIGEINSTPTWINNFTISNVSFNNLDIEEVNQHDLVVFDSYNYRDILSKISTNKLLINDLNYLNTENYDIVLDYNIGSSKDLYKEKSLRLVDPNFFPISESSLPEYINKCRNAFDEEGDILLSFGGVSDEKLINIKNEIKYYSNYGRVVLMDPLSKLGKFNNQVYKLISGKSLSDVFSNYKFKFCKVAGGTSKYIAMTYKVPIIYVYRNLLEKILIDKVAERQLLIYEDKISSKSDFNNNLINLHNKYKNLFDNNLNDELSKKIINKLK